MKTARWSGIGLLARRFVLGLACAAMLACQSLRPIEGPPAELREGLRAGRLVKAGDQLEIRTAAGEVYQLEVVSVDQEDVRGAGRVVPINDIVGLKRKELNVGRSLLLAAGIVVVVIGVAAASYDPDYSFDWDSGSGGGD